MISCLFYSRKHPNIHRRTFISVNSIFQGRLPMRPCKKGSRLSDKLPGGRELSTSVKFKGDSLHLTLSELICIIHTFIAVILTKLLLSLFLCHYNLQRLHHNQQGSYSEEEGGGVQLDAHLISDSLRALCKEEREKASAHTHSHRQAPLR